MKHLAWLTAACVALAPPAFAQTAASTRQPSVEGGGQSPAQAAHDMRPNHTRASPYSHPGSNPNQPGDAASDGTAGTSSPRSPEPKPNG